MSAPAKEPQLLGSRSGKRGYIRICVVCGKVMKGVGNNTKYCPECRRERENAAAREHASCGIAPNTPQAGTSVR